MSVKEVYTLDYRKRDALAQSNPFEFRRKARKAIALYPSALRRMHKQLSTPTLLVHDFYVSWEQELRPLRDTIAKATVATAFHSTVKKRLVLEDASTFELIDRLVHERDAEAVRRFLDSSYTIKQSSSRSVANEILQGSANAVQNQKDVYVDYELYRIVASEHKFTIPDSENGRIRFYLQSLREKMEVKQYTKISKRRLEAICTLQNKLEAKNNGLASKIFTLQLDVVEVLTARHAYEKRLDKLSSTTRKSPVKRLAFFEAETKKIRDTYVEKVADSAKLASVQQMGKEIDDVLIQIFDMAVVERNELMTRMKEYRDLSREKQQITTILNSK